MICPICGKNLPEGTRVCGSCGSDVSFAAGRAPANPEGFVSNEESGYVDRRDAKRSAAAELKEAKAAYRAARKNAGKGAGRTVAGYVACAVVAAAVAAGATWYALEHHVQQVQLQAEASIETARQELAEARSALAEAQAAAEEAQAEAEALRQSAAEAEAAQSTREDGEDAASAQGPETDGEEDA